jgi:hypothetical protein
VTEYVAMFRGWLPALEQDSTDIYGLTPREMSTDELRRHLTKMGLALMVECGELIEETQWKDWKKPDSKFPVRNSRQTIAREAVDVLHFLAHILNACGVTEDDLNWEMMDKRSVNQERQQRGYSYDD